MTTIHLISCDNCAVVLDKDRLSFPSDIYSKETGEFLEDLCEIGIDGKYIAIVQCPVCDNNIREDT